MTTNTARPRRKGVVGTPELCNMLGVTDRTVRRWHAAGIIRPLEQQNRTCHLWDIRDTLRQLKRSGRFTAMTLRELGL